MTEKYTIIVGCGRLGANLANTLSDSGESITIIDKDEDSFRKLAQSYAGMTQVGDGTDTAELIEANIKDATAVVAVTNNDNINIFVAQLAKEYFHVPDVIARLYDPDKELVYKEFGIDTISPALLSAKEIDRILRRVDIDKALEIAMSDE
jgi:trk system potassium uptake protein TrkA